MSSPSPVIVKFLAEGTPQILRALRSIAEAVAGSEQKSTAVAKMGSSWRTHIKQQEAQAQARELIKLGDLEKAAELAGSKFVAKVLRDRLTNKLNHAKESFKLAQAEKDKERAFEVLSGKKGLAAIDAEERKKLALRRGFAREARQIELERLKGVGPVANPSLSHHARSQAISKAMDALPGAQGPKQIKALEDQLAHAQGLREEAKISRDKFAKGRAAAMSLDAEVTKIHEKGERDRAALNRTYQVAYERTVAQWNQRQLDERVKSEEKAAKARQHFFTTVHGGVSNAASGTATIAGKVANGLFNTMTGLGGGFTVQGALQERLDEERSAAHIAVKSDGAFTTADVQKKARAVAIRTGTDAAKVQAGWGAYADKSGDWKGGEQLSEFIAKYSKVGDVDPQKAGYVAGLLRNQNKDLDAAGMQQMLLDVMEQGRSGAVDVPELIGHLAGIGKTAGRFSSGTQAENQRKLIALSQIGVETGTVAEVATGLSHISSDTQKHADKVNALLGRNALNGRGDIQGSPEAFLADMMTAAGGNTQKLYHAGIGERGIKIFDALKPTWNKAEDEALAAGASPKEAKAAARAAIEKKMAEPINQTMTMGQLNKDFATIMATSAEQFEKAVRQLKMEVADGLLPVLKDLLPLFRQLIPPLAETLTALTKLAALAAQNPFEGVGAVFSGYLGKELLAAGLAEKLKSIATGAPEAGLGLAALGGVVAGVTMQIGLLSDYLDRYLGAETRGKAEGEKLAAAVAQNGGVADDATAARLADVTNKSSTPRQAMRYADEAFRIGGMIANPQGAAMNFLGDQAASSWGDKAASWLGFDTKGRSGKSSSEYNDETHEASKIANTFEQVISSGDLLKSALEHLTSAAQTAADGLQSGPANPGDGSRNGPMGRREGG